MTTYYQTDHTKTIGVVLIVDGELGFKETFCRAYREKKRIKGLDGYYRNSDLIKISNTPKP